jgi:hypothetical protein
MADKKNLPPVMFEDCRILFRNFSGKEGRYNPKGKRTFSLLLDEAQATAMLEDGWNVKFLRPREEGDPPQAHIEVEARYSERFRPPRIILITSRGRSSLPEDMIDLLDYADIEQVDMMVNPSFWDVNGKSGVKAYLQSIYVTIREDPLERKYSDIPEIGGSIVVDAEIIEEGDSPLAITSGETPF